MKRFLLFGLVLVLALGAFALVGCGGGDDDVVDDVVVDDVDGLPAEVQAIKDRGVLRVGVKNDVPGFGLLNPETNEYEGIEINMARQLAKDIIGDENAVEFEAVTADTRGTLLDNGQIDMVIATFTIKPERLEQWNFTDPYYRDAVGLLVLKDSGISSIKDLDGKKIGVALGATSMAAVEEAGEADGLTFVFQEMASYPEINTALGAKTVDAFSVDKSILRGYLDDKRVLLDDEFSPQDYGIATKLSNADLAKYVNDFVNRIKNDGTLDAWIADFKL
jgi:putative glutamine transport system substrate-binding protein